MDILWWGHVVIRLRLVCCDRRQKYSIFLWAQEDGTWSQWFNGHHIMFLLTTSYHSIGTSLLNSTKDEWLKLKSFCFRLFSSYESIIGVRCDENSEVVKKNCNSIQQQMHLLYGCHINDRIWNWNGSEHILIIEFKP